MEEVIIRRTLGAVRHEDPWPDLIVIDGGKGQLSSAITAMKKTLSETQNDTIESVEPPLIISLAKREEEVFLP